MAKPRKRNVGKESQRSKSDDSDIQKREEHVSKPSGGSSTGVIVILTIMVAITWGVAATAYFGVVDYKSLAADTSDVSAADVAEYISALYPLQYDAVRHPLRALGNKLARIDDIITNFFTFTRAPYDIIDKRRPVTGTSPARQMKRSLVRKDVSQPPPAVDVPPVTSKAPLKDDVASPEEPKPDEPKQKQPEKRKEEPPKPKPSDEKPRAKPDKKTETGKGGKSDKTKQNDKQKTKSTKKSITCESDKKILEKLKEGEKLLKEKKGDQAWKFFQKLAKEYPDSPRAKYHRAQAEEMVAEQQRSNPMLLQAIKSYNEVVELADCPRELMRRSLMAKSEKEMFLGRMKPALESQIAVAKMFPKDVEVLNKLGVRYLMVGHNKAAKKIYETVLRLDPNDGFALVHMGFIKKNAGEWEESIEYLKRGTESNEPGTQEGKFYFHLGDALHRTNRTVESEEVYEMAAQKGLFRSKYQRSLYNVDRLKGQPYWTVEEAGTKDYVRRLEMNWKTIRDEALAVMNKETGLFELEEESLKDTGEWRQFTLFAKGVKNEANCRRTPKTCNIIDRMPNAKGCRRGQVKFSVMMPGTHVWRHTGPTNCRLRMHLGLVIPTTGSGARLACAGEMKTWDEGKVLIFDDSFEHEVWQEAESFRLILIVDVWHPELTEHEKKTLTAI